MKDRAARPVSQFDPARRSDAYTIFVTRRGQLAIGRAAAEQLHEITGDDVILGGRRIAASCCADRLGDRGSCTRLAIVAVAGNRARTDRDVIAIAGKRGSR